MNNLKFWKMEKENINTLKFKLDALKKINQLINLYGQLDEVLQETIYLLIKLVDADGGIILLFDERSEELTVVASHFRDEEGIKDKKIKIEPSKTQMKKIWETNKPLIVNNISKEKDHIVETIGYSVKNVLRVPLVRKNKVLGIIEVYNKKSLLEGFSEEDVSLVSSLSNEIAIIIENACLFNRLERKIEELNNLLKATEVVYSSLDLRVVLNTIMSLAMQLLNAEAASVLLVDEEQGELYFIVAPGEKREKLERIHLKKGEGIASWVAEKGRPLLIPDVSREPRFAKRIDQISGFKTKSILCMPLKVGNKVVGVVEAINKKNGANFGSDDIHICNALAGQSAMAIEKAKLYKDMEDLFISTIKSIAEAVEAKDPYTRGHCERIRKYSLLIAEGLEITEKEKKDIEIAALLHDVGKIGVPEALLRKEGKLTEQEWKIVKKHPEIGAQILGSIKQLKEVIPAIRHHQERFDGNGYPDGLKGEEIPLASRIIAVADTFDAMTSERPYRNSFSDEEVLEEIKRNAGSQFDPQCVKAFFLVYNKELKEILKRQES